MAFGDYAALVSDFSGPDEDPLSEGGDWVTDNPAFPSVHLKKVSNLVTNNQVSPSFNDKEYRYTPKQYGPDVEMYLTVAALNPALNDQIDMAFRIGDLADGGHGYRLASSHTGYELQKVFDFSSGVGSIDVATGGSFGIAAGDLFGMRIQCFTIDVWVNHQDGAGWHQLAKFVDVDTDYFTAGYVAFGCSQSSTQIGPIYAGTVPRLRPCVGATGLWLPPAIGKVFPASRIRTA